MPEGDTIFRAARALNAAIGGREVTAFRSPLPKLAGADLAGRRGATGIGGVSVLVSEGLIEVG